jgi:hypothetical protein
MRARAAVLGVLLAVAGCGVEPQAGPEPLDVSPPPPAEPSGLPEPDGPRVTVYFVRGAALAPVVRATAGSDADAAVQQLVAGPTRPEVLSGLRTALAPQALEVDERPVGGLTTVAVTREFTGVSGGNQLLAVAQVVWTLTELPGTTEVRFLVDGAPVEVPTDEGLTDEPVDRGDYGSVAPQGSSSTTAGSGTAPPGTSAD